MRSPRLGSRDGGGLHQRGTEGRREGTEREGRESVKVSGIHVKHGVAR